MRAARQRRLVPLNLASSNGHRGVVEALIGSKAAIEAQDNVRLSRDAGDIAQGAPPPGEGCPMCAPMCRSGEQGCVCVCARLGGPRIGRRRARREEARETARFACP